MADVPTSDWVVSVEDGIDPWIDRHESSMEWTVAWSVPEAKERFDEVVIAARSGAPQVVTQEGQASVVVVAAEDFDRLCDAVKEKPADFSAYLRSIPPADDDEPDFERLAIRPREITF